MACYAAHLAMGGTLLCKSIRSATIRKYLSAAAKYFTNNRRPDPSHSANGQQYSLLRSILLEQERWESMPRRREPLTWPMVDHLRSLPSCKCDWDGLDAAMADWCVLGMFGGFRLSEWAQPTNEVDKRLGYKLNVDHTATAFIASDVSFHDQSHCLIKWHPEIDPALLASVTLTWRFQKNKVNQAKRSFGAREDVVYCPVRAIHRILLRAHRLQLAPHLPLAIFRLRNRTQFITDKHIDASLRSCATQVYKLDNPDDIKRFSSHSIRVGACVYMHECGKDAVFIQFRLRWESDTWKMYLRNTHVIANSTQTYLLFLL